MNVLSYLLSMNTSGRRAIEPRKLTIQPGDDYLLFLAARFLETTKFPSSGLKHIRWSKKENGQLRAGLEASWNPEVRPVYIVQGAPEGWLKTVDPSREVPLIISQEKHGELTPDSVDPKNVRSLLLLLKEIHDGKGPWDLPKAAAADWSWIESWADVEPSIVRMCLLQEDEPVTPHGQDFRISSALLGLVRTVDIAALLQLGEKYSFPWLHRALCEESVRIAQVKGLLEKGVAEDRLRSVMDDWSWRDERVVEESAHWGWADLRKMAEELIIHDWSRSSRPRIELGRIVLGKKYDLIAHFS